MPFTPPFMVFARNQSSEAFPYHTGKATAIVIAMASRSGRET